ncbi:MAG: DUF4870 domain-containing protein [Haloechinothrix sp.]
MTDNPAAPPPQDNPAGAVTSTGLEPNIAALLSYVLGAITGLIFFLIEKKHQEVRFHAAQSLLFSGGLAVLAIVVNILLFALPWGLAGVISAVMLLVWLAAFGVWIYLMVSAYQLKHVKLPVIGDFAEKMAASQSR